MRPIRIGPEKRFDNADGAAARAVRAAPAREKGDQSVYIPPPFGSDVRAIAIGGRAEEGRRKFEAPPPGAYDPAKPFGTGARTARFAGNSRRKSTPNQGVLH
jgi:hypothetical protein